MSDKQEPNGNPNPWAKSLLVWGGIFLALLLVVSMFGAGAQPAGTQMPYSDFRAKVAEGSVAKVEIGQERITGTLKNDQTFTTIPVPGDTSLPQLLEQNGVQFQGQAAEEPNLLLYIRVQSLPVLLRNIAGATSAPQRNWAS